MLHLDVDTPEQCGELIFQMKGIRWNYSHNKFCLLAIVLSIKSGSPCSG